MSARQIVLMSRLPYCNGAVPSGLAAVEIAIRILMSVQDWVGILGTEDNSIMRDQTVSGAQFNEVSKQAIRDVGSLGAVAMDPMVLARIRQEATGQ